MEERVDRHIEDKKIMPSQLGAFILSNSKRVPNNFSRPIDGFRNKNIYYQETDSLYIEKKHWEKLDKFGLVGNDLCQDKNDYGDGGIFYSLFLAPKIKYSLTINEYGLVEEHKKFKVLEM